MEENYFGGLIDKGLGFVKTGLEIRDVVRGGGGNGNQQDNQRSALAQQKSSENAQTGSAIKWAVIGIGVVVLGFLGWKFLGKGK